MNIKMLLIKAMVSGMLCFLSFSSLFANCNSTKANQGVGCLTVEGEVLSGKEDAEKNKDLEFSVGSDNVYHVKNITGRVKLVGSSMVATLVLEVDQAKLDEKEIEESATNRIVKFGSMLAIVGELTPKINLLQGKEVKLNGTVIPITKWNNDPVTKNIKYFHPNLKYVIEVTSFTKANTKQDQR